MICFLDARQPRAHAGPNISLDGGALPRRRRGLVRHGLAVSERPPAPVSGAYPGRFTYRLGIRDCVLISPVMPGVQLGRIDNDPKNDLILVNRARWLSTSEPAIRQAVLLHELLSLTDS